MRTRNTSKRRSRRSGTRRRAATAKPIRLRKPLITPLLQGPQNTEGGLAENVLAYYSPNAVQTIRLFEPVLSSPNVPEWLKLPVGFLVGAAYGQALIDTAEGILGGKRRR